MKIKCDYCNSTYEDTLEKCPACGAPNSTQKGSHDNAPKTIGELKAWYTARHLPPEETTRFFIGKNIEEPRAFGIYQDNGGNFVVYKNKADGTRAVRYRGKDEAYAVNELYQKLKDEIINQKSRQSKNTRSSANSKGTYHALKFLIIGVWAAVMIASVIAMIGANRHNGYYNYNGSTYYHYQSHWYRYDDYFHDYSGLYQYSYDGDYGGWTEVYDDPAVDAIESDYDGYFTSKNWDSSLGASNWNDSEFYDDFHSSSDSSYDWDSSDSWDSGGTDWDSDW